MLRIPLSLLGTSLRYVFLFFYSRFENLSSKLAFTSKSSQPLPEATYEYMISKKRSLGDCVRVSRTIQMGEVACRWLGKDGGEVFL